MDAKTTDAYNKLLKRLTPEQRAQVDALRAAGDEKSAYRIAQGMVLSDWQKAASENMKRPAGNAITEIIAAAGSGKTTLTTSAVSDVIAEKILPTRSVFVTTFTAKAAGEIRERIGRMVPGADLSGLRMGTFHSLCRRYMAGKAKSNPQGQPQHGWEMNLNIEKGQQSPGDIVWFLGRIIGKPFARRKTDLPPHRRSVPPWELTDEEKWVEVPGLPGFYGLTPEKEKKDPPDGKEYAAALELITAQGYAITDEEGLVLARKHEIFQDPESPNYDPEVPFLKSFVRVWEQYERAKRNLGMWDYADLLRAYWKDGTDKAALVIVDEAQDNSLVQLNIARMLAENGDGRLFLVGDIRQSIYQWRGAEPAFMAEAPEKLGADMIQLPVNYRSGQQIVDIGNAVATGKWWSIGMEAIAFRGERGFLGDIRFMQATTLMQEADAVARDIRKHLDAGVNAKDIGILVRTNAPGASFEIACLKHNVPAFRLGSRAGFFDRRPIKVAMAYATLALRDDWDALALAANMPKRYLGGETLVRAIREKVRETDIIRGLDKILELRGRLPGDGKRQSYFDKQLSAIQQYRDVILRLRAAPWRRTDDDGKPLASDTDVPGIIARTMTKAREKDEETEDEAETEASQTAGDPTSDTDAELIGYFLDIARNFTSLADVETLAKRLKNEVEGMDFTEKSEDELNAMRPQWRAEYDKEKKRYDELLQTRLVITTIHKSKGLEWDRVYLSATDGTFPHFRSTGPKRAAEEERLFYVACTRAADVLTLSCSMFNMQGRASGVSPYIEDYVIPVVNRHMARTALLAYVRPLELAGWQTSIAGSGEDAVFQMSSPDGRIIARFTAGDLPLWEVVEQPVKSPTGRDESVRVFNRAVPDDAEVAFDTFVVAHTEDEPHHREHPVPMEVVDADPAMVAARLLTLHAEASAVYGSVLEALPMKRLVVGQPTVADISGRWTQVDFQGYAGGPLYRARVKGQEAPIPQNLVRHGDGVDVEFEEYIAFIGKLPRVDGTTGASFADALTTVRHEVLPLFRAVMNEPAPAQVDVDQPIPAEVPTAPEPAPAPGHGVPVPPHTEVMEMAPGDWRVYRGGNAVCWEGVFRFATRDEADQAARFGEVQRVSVPAGSTRILPRNAEEEARDAELGPLVVTPLRTAVAQAATTTGQAFPPEHHIAAYNGKMQIIDYVAIATKIGAKDIPTKPKDIAKKEYNLAAMRIVDNVADGYVITPKGEVHEIKRNSKRSRLIEGEMRAHVLKSLGFGSASALTLRESLELLKKKHGFDVGDRVYFADETGREALWQGEPTTPWAGGTSYRIPFHWSGGSEIHLGGLHAEAHGVPTLEPTRTEVWTWTGPAPGVWVLDEGGKAETPPEPEPVPTEGTVTVEQAQRMPAGSLFAVATDGGGWEFFVANGQGGVTYASHISDHMTGAEFWPLADVPTATYGVEVVYAGKGKILTKATNTQKFEEWLESRPRSAPQATPAGDTREPWQIPYDEFVRIPRTAWIRWGNTDYTPRSAEIELAKARASAKKEGQQIEWNIVTHGDERATIEGIHTLDADDKRRIHTAAVWEAAKAGKHVPAVVLADFHDLLKGEGGLMTPDEAAAEFVAGTHPAIHGESTSIPPATFESEEPPTLVLAPPPPAPEPEAPPAPVALPSSPVWQSPPRKHPEAQGEWLMPDGSYVWLRVSSADNETTELGHTGEQTRSFPTYVEAVGAAHALWGVEAPAPRLLERRSGTSEDAIGYWDLPGGFRVGLLRRAREGRLSFATSAGISFEDYKSVDLAIRDLERRFGVHPPEQAAAPVKVAPKRKGG